METKTEYTFILSVCITTFNMEQYIARALDSVLSQKVNFDYEIIVADDCSTDNTINILQQYQQQIGEKFKIIYAEKNKGVLKNFSKAFMRAKGKYIATLDADDYWIDNNKLQQQTDTLDSNNEIGFVYTNFFYELDGTNQRKLGASLDYIASKNIFQKNILRLDVTFSTCCFRKSVLANDELNTFIEKKILVQDLPIILSYSQHSQAYYLSCVTTVYNFRQGSNSRDFDVKKRIELNKNNFQTENYFIEKYPIPLNIDELRIFNFNKNNLLTAWPSQDFDLVKHYAKNLKLNQFLKHDFKASYIFIASKSKFLYQLFKPWVLRKRKFGK